MSETQYITSKLDNKIYCKANGHFSKHLKQCGLTLKEYYETYVTGITPLCSCLKPATFYKNNTYAKSCGSPVCVGKSVSIARQSLPDDIKQQHSNNYKQAQKNKSKSQRLLETAKKKETYKQKYGVEWATSELQKSKSRSTKFSKYGIETYNNSVVSAEKNRNKSISEQSKINEKREYTNLNRYGVKNTLMLASNIQKANKGNSSIKDYMLPSGIKIGVRGYEPFALDILFCKGFTETDINVHNNYGDYTLPIFEYTAVNRHKLCYYPDIFIPKENKIIEVKSRWWWDGNGDLRYASRLENNLRKRKAVLEKGYNYEVWIFEDKHIYKILINDSDF
jgi:hypothetical protein